MFLCIFHSCRNRDCLVWIFLIDSHWILCQPQPWTKWRWAFTFIDLDVVKSNRFWVQGKSGLVKMACQFCADPSTWDILVARGQRIQRTNEQRPVVRYEETDTILLCIIDHCAELKREQEWMCIAAKTTLTHTHTYTRTYTCIVHIGDWTLPLTSKRAIY